MCAGAGAVAGAVVAIVVAAVVVIVECENKWRKWQALKIYWLSTILCNLTQGAVYQLRSLFLLECIE